MDGKKQLLPFGYVATWGGLLRTCLWCLFFLWIAGLPIPKIPEDIPFSIATRGTPVVPMVTIADDSRFLREDKPIDHRKLNIAWITDSTGVILAPDETFMTRTEEHTKLLPGQTAKMLQEEFGLNNFSIRLYAQLGMRPIDKLIFFIRVLQDKPDLIVAPMNYFYDFGHYNVLGVNAPLPLLLSTFSQKASLWPLIPLLSNPANDMFSLVGRHVRVIREAVPIKRYAEKRYLENSMTQISNPSATTVLFDLPLNNTWVWVYNTILHRNTSALLDRNGALSTVKLNQYLVKGSTPDATKSLASETMRTLIGFSNNAKIPVLMYMMPLKQSFYASPISFSAFKRIEAYVDALSDTPANLYTQIIPRIPTDVQDSLTFRPDDGRHLLSSGELPNYLAGLIWDDLKKYNLEKKARVP